MRKDIFTNASMFLALLLCGGAMAEAVPASVSTVRFEIDTFSSPREIKTSEELEALYDATYFSGETVSMTAPGGSVTELVSSAAADGEVALPINASGIWTLVNSAQGSSSIAVRYSLFGSGGEGTAESPARAVSAGEFAELVAQGKTSFIFENVFCYSPGTVIDLKGTYVKMPSSIACGSIAFTVTNTTEEDGTLEVEVPQGVTATNSGMALTGNIRLVKSGPGTLIAGLRSQTYSGGTEVAAGVLMAKFNGAANGGHLFGEYDSQIVIREGATFDMNAQPQNNNYLYVLDGGTVTSSAAGFTSGNIMFKDIILTADSRVNGQNDIGLIQGGYEPTSLDLGGHTLTIDIATAKYFYLMATEVKNGTIDVVVGTFRLSHLGSRGKITKIDFVGSRIRAVGNGKGFNPHVCGKSIVVHYINIIVTVFCLIEYFRPQLLLRLHIAGRRRHGSFRENEHVAARLVLHHRQNESRVRRQCDRQNQTWRLGRRRRRLHCRLVDASRQHRHVDVQERR